MTTGNPPEGLTVIPALDPAEPGITQYLHIGAEVPILAAGHEGGEPMNDDDYRPPQPDYMRAYPCDPAGFDWDLAEARHSDEAGEAWDALGEYRLDRPDRDWPGAPRVCDEELRRRR